MKWLSSYFTDRQQSVKVHGSFSNYREVKAGVVQGSVIGPLLFSAYINGVANNGSDNEMRLLFADDLLLLAPYNTEQDRAIVQNSIDDIRGKTSQLQMKLNSSKCCSMTLSEGRLPFVPAAGHTIAESGLPVSEQGLPYLGVLFDSKLNWSPSTRQVVTKAKRAIGSIRRTCGKILTQHQRQT